MTFREFIKSVVQKLSSAKLWITLWAMVMASKMIFSGQDGVALNMLLAAPLSFMGLNVLQDFIFRNK
jgi:hypothetical protein